MSFGINPELNKLIKLIIFSSFNSILELFNLYILNSPFIILLGEWIKIKPLSL